MRRAGTCAGGALAQRRGEGVRGLGGLGDPGGALRPQLRARGAQGARAAVQDVRRPGRTGGAEALTGRAEGRVVARGRVERSGSEGAAEAVAGLWRRR